MSYLQLSLIVGLALTTPAFGQEVNPNKIGPGSVPANIYDAVELVRERQIIDERPAIRDFRVAPESPMVQFSPEQIREIPAGAKVPIAFDTPINNATSKAGDKFSARTLESIRDADGYVLLPVGAIVKGTVVQSNEWANDKHILKNDRPRLRFDSVELAGRAPILSVATFASEGGNIACRRDGQSIPIRLSAYSTLPSTWLFEGRIIDVRVGNQYWLEFPEGLRIIWKQ
jgi:hypothetical protein